MMDFTLSVRPLHDAEKDWPIFFHLNTFSKSVNDQVLALCLVKPNAVVLTVAFEFSD